MLRKTILAQLEAVRNIMDDTLGRYVSRFPSLDQVAPYHAELIKLLIGERTYRGTLASVDRTRHNAVGLLNRAMQEIGRELAGNVLGDVKKRTYGRVSSIIYDAERPLRRLADFRATLKRLPAVSPGLYTVVIAGYPNVGKSSLIRALTHAEPEVASYPFTTKAANVGHMEVPDPRGSSVPMRIQLIDTPGLLDRPESERNAIEHQASLALRHLADLVLFLRDPTGHCGFPVTVQERLLAEVRGVVGDVPLVVAETKTDLGHDNVTPEGITAPALRFSTYTGDGVEELRTFVVQRARQQAAQPLENYLRGEGLPSYRVRRE